MNILGSRLMSAPTVPLSALDKLCLAAGVAQPGCAGLWEVSMLPFGSPCSCPTVRQDMMAVTGRGSCLPCVGQGSS